MNYSLILIKIGKRDNVSSSVQKILTEFGCNIKVRLGLHDLPENSCSSSGLIILEVTGEKHELEKAVENLNKIKEVKAQLIEI